MKFTNTDCVREEAYWEVMRTGQREMLSRPSWKRASYFIGGQVRGQINPIRNKIKQEIER